MKLHDLRPAEGSRKERTRVGRGIAAGKGKTAGRGTKGQKARAGGSIPLVSALLKQFPAAEILLFGAEDEEASIHAPNERVDLEELRRIATTEALFLHELSGPSAHGV